MLKEVSNNIILSYIPDQLNYPNHDTPIDLLMFIFLYNLSKDFSLPLVKQSGSSHE